MMDRENQGNEKMNTAEAITIVDKAPLLVLEDEALENAKRTLTQEGFSGCSRSAVRSALNRGELPDPTGVERWLRIFSHLMIHHNETHEDCGCSHKNLQDAMESLGARILIIDRMLRNRGETVSQQQAYEIITRETWGEGEFANHDAMNATLLLVAPAEIDSAAYGCYGAANPEKTRLLN